jgi:hypothetical protein
MEASTDFYLGIFSISLFFGIVLLLLGTFAWRIINQSQEEIYAAI